MMILFWSDIHYITRHSHKTQLFKIFPQILHFCVKNCSKTFNYLNILHSTNITGSDTKISTSLYK